MKYSIKGKLIANKEVDVISLLNQFTLWKLLPGKAKDRETGVQYFIFEVWLNSMDQMTNLYEQLKFYVNTGGEIINWHECTHDEENPQPCTIAEEYRGD